MFNIHNPKINSFAQRNPDNFFMVVMMVSLSIQQKWLLVGEMLSDMATNKSESIYIWGNKKNTYDYMTTHKHFMYGQMMAVINSTNLTDLAKSLSLMKIFLKVDGLGRENNTKKLHEYITLCHNYGTENLWNSWCSMIAEKYPKDFVDANHVSEVHYTFLTGENNV